MRTQFHLSLSFNYSGRKGGVEEDGQFGGHDIRTVFKYIKYLNKLHHDISFIF